MKSRSATTLAIALVATVSLTGCSQLRERMDAPQPPAGGVSIVTHPNQSPGKLVTSYIDNAQKRVWMEMYSLNDDDVVHSLINAKKRGVDVRVMLNHGYGVSKSTKRSYAELASAKVPVKWGPSGYIFHIKTTVVDDFADISTANLNHNNYASTVDYSVIDKNTDHVNAISKTFSNDWTLKGKPAEHTVNSPGLVWSPKSENTFVSTITSAKKSVEFSSEELKGLPVANALADRAKHGVKCVIHLPQQSGNTNTSEQALNTVKSAGCSVTMVKSTSTHYLHAKQIIIDDTRALIGSQNDSTTSLNRNRELSIMVTDPNSVDIINNTFDLDNSPQ